GTTVSSGTLTVGGGSAAASLGGAITVASGATLATSSGVTNALGDASALTVNGTLNLGSNDTVGSLALTKLGGSAATLGGTATLTTATTAALDGGTVNTGLTAGTTLTSAGATAVNATVSAGTSATITADNTTIGTAGKLVADTTVNPHATLTLAGTGPIDRLGDGQALTVQSLGQVSLAGQERVGALTLTGSVTGGGNFLADSLALNNTIVTSNLTVVNLTSSGTSEIKSTVNATGSATVLGGSLTVWSGGSLTSPVMQVNSGAVLQVGLGTSAGSLGAGTVKLATGGRLVIDRDSGLGSQTISNNIEDTDASNHGQVQKTGSGTVLLRGTNTYSGGTTITAGKLDINAGTQLGSGAVTLAGGSLLASGTATVANAVVVGSAGGAIEAASSTTLTLGGGVSDTPAGGVASHGTLSKQGSGTLSLGAGSLVLDTVTVADGVLATTAANQIGDGTALTVNGTLNLGGNDTVASLALTKVGGSAATLGGSGTLSTTGTAALTSGTVNTGLTAGTTLSSSGTSVINAAATSGTGTTVSSGTLTVGGGSAAASLGGAITV
ncbi:MAG: hypothetical protein CFE45_42855, partial [Burkholderiales bacterium PBB5]